MTIREQLVILAWTSCGATVLFIAMCLSPGLYEIQERVSRFTNRARGSRKAARHGLEVNQTDVPDLPGDGGDPAATQATAC